MSNPITCQQAMQEILSAENPPKALSGPASEHLKTCPQCQQLVAELARVESAVRDLPVPALGKAPSGAFLARVREFDDPPAMAPAGATLLTRAAWWRRVAAAAAIVIFAIAALTLFFSNDRTAQAESLLQDLAAWNAQLSEAHDPAARTRIYQTRAQEMKRRMDRAALDALHRSVAEKLYSNATWLQTPHDPLLEAQQLAEISDWMGTQRNASAHVATEIELLQRTISGAASKDLLNVDPAQLTPDDKQRWETIRNKVAPAAAPSDRQPPESRPQGTFRNLPSVPSIAGGIRTPELTAASKSGTSGSEIATHLALPPNPSAVFRQSAPAPMVPAPATEPPPAIASRPSLTDPSSGKAGLPLLPASGVAASHGPQSGTHDQTGERGARADRDKDMDDDAFHLPRSSRPVSRFPATPIISKPAAAHSAQSEVPIGPLAVQWPDRDDPVYQFGVNGKQEVPVISLAVALGQLDATEDSDVPQKMLALAPAAPWADLLTSDAAIPSDLMKGKYLVFGSSLNDSTPLSIQAAPEASLPVPETNSLLLAAVGALALLTRNRAGRPAQL